MNYYQDNKENEAKIWAEFEASEYTGEARNFAALRMAEHIQDTIGNGTQGVQKFKEWNQQKNMPALTDQEWRPIWERVISQITPSQSQEQSVDMLDGGSGGKYDKKKGIKAPDIVATALLTGMKLFLDQNNEEYAAVPINGHMETMKCKSSSFKGYLQKLCWDEYLIAPGSEMLKTVVGNLTATARFSQIQMPLHLRVAWHEGALWYDLCDPDWRAVKITVGGWEIVDHPPILFRRYAHQKQQAVPNRGGATVHDLLTFVNVSDEDKKLLLLVYMVAAFIPDFAHPILSVYGPYGSAKSNLSRLLRRLIDPSIIGTISFPKNVAELAQVLAHHHILFFDNLSGLSEEESDALCKAVTGDAFSKRSLYTDDEDHIYVFRRVIALNGINLVGSKPDLLERSLLMELERIEPSARKTEAEIDRAFGEILPDLLGAIFDVIALALAVEESVVVQNPPRMADFARWGTAIAQALDYPTGAFLDAYRKNLKSQNEQVLEDDEVAQSIQLFIADWKENVWFGKPAELYKAVKKYASDNPSWPKEASVFMKRLNVVKTNLADVGVKITQSKTGNRLVTIQKTDQNAAATALALPETKSNP